MHRLRPFHYCSIAVVAILGLLWWSHASEIWYLVVLLVYLHLLILGSVMIRWNFYLVSKNRGANEKWLSLTFDDGPATVTAEVLDVLKQYQVPAAFFLIGKNVDALPGLAKRYVDEGHLVGNHSYHHGFHFDWQSTKKMREEMERTNRAITAATGHMPRLFRPPYGVTNPNLASAVKKSNMISIGWSLRSFDTTAKDADKLLQKLKRKLKGGDIVLFHDSMHVTLQTLPEFIQFARQKGFVFVALDQMLEVEAYA